MTNIFVAGHKGMVGGSIHRLLSTRPDINLITAEKDDLVKEPSSSIRIFQHEKN